MGLAARKVNELGGAPQRSLRDRFLAREGPLGYTLLMPTLLVLGVFLAYPFIIGVWLSVTNANLDSAGHWQPAKASGDSETS